MASYHSEHHEENNGQIPSQFNNFFNMLNQLQSGESGDFEEGQKRTTCKKVIETLPTTEITLEEYANQLACPVCIEVFEMGTHPVRLPCFHIFHKECARSWLEQNNTCPSCRTELPTPDENYNEELHRKKLEESQPPCSMYG